MVSNSMSVAQYQGKCRAYEEQFSYYVKFDEVCGIVAPPDTDIEMYKLSESCYIDIKELGYEY